MTGALFALVLIFQTPQGSQAFVIDYDLTESDCVSQAAALQNVTPNLPLKCEAQQ